MSVILDTTLPKQLNTKVFNAFMYGIIEGSYSLYRAIDTDVVAIRFENEEDATIFKLKELDVVFNDRFYNDKASMPNYTSTFGQSHTTLFDDSDIWRTIVQGNNP